MQKRQRQEAFLKVFGQHLNTLNLPTDDELFDQKDKNNNALGNKLLDLAKQKHIDQDSQESFINFDKLKKKNYLNLFQVDRGPCKLCECDQYRPCYNIESFRDIELFQCLNCGCPMNSHSILKSEYSFSNPICQQINRRYIQESQLQFKSCLSIYFVDSTTASDFKIDIENFITSLNEGGFNSLSFYEMDISTLQKLWIEKALYSRKLNIQDNTFQKYKSFLNTFFEMINQYGINQENLMKTNLQNSQDIQILDFYLNRLRKVNQKLYLPYQRNKIAFIFLISGNSNTLHQDYQKFIYAAQKQLPYLYTDYQKYMLEEIKQEQPELQVKSTQLFFTKSQRQQLNNINESQRQFDLVYFYSSKSKQKSIRDCQLFFPQFFKLNIVTFLLTQQKDEIHQEKKKMNDTFMDMLDFNNISVFKQDFTQVLQKTISEAFKFIQNSEQFIKIVQFDGSSHNIKIGYKIGIQSLNIMYQNLPNYYKVSNQIQNQTICDKLSPELFINQRILIIYRPIVIKSNLQGILNNIWKLNDYIEIDSEYVRFTIIEAKMLAQIEKIHPINLNNYLTMMTEGYSQIVLYTRPGAYQGAKIISDGCRTGLKIRQSKQLQDLNIQHQAKTGKFIEKLPMNFHNFFESFTQQNIFLSIKDIFNLEELVLQDNQNTGNKNIFTQDDHVFMIQNQQEQNNISQQLRHQLIKDLPKENYNYYICTSIDDITTEQLVSLLIPRCTQIEHIYIIIKPINNDYKQQYIEEIKKLIQRMKFYIFDCQSFNLNEEQIKTIINYINPYKYTNEIMENYINQYKNNPIYILSLMKQAGLKEMISFLTGFNFDIIQFQIPHLIQELKPFLIPCINVEIKRFISELFHPYLAKFDALTFNQKDIDITYLLKYMLHFTVGINLKNYEKMLQESTYRHIHYRVESDNHGDFEIRIRSNYDLQNYTKEYELTYEYELLSWYYCKINLLFAQRCPPVYQYRILYPERIIKGEIDQVFDCQEFPGRNFLLEIQRQIFDFGFSVFEALKNKKLKYVEEKYKNNNQDILKKDIKNFEDQMEQVNRYMDMRSKMISYYWGIKLAKFSKELELINSDEDFPNGFGDIMHREGVYECKYKINTPEYKHPSYIYKKHYKLIFEKINSFIYEKIENDPTYYDELNYMQQSNFEFGQSQLFSQAEQRKDGTKTFTERRIIRLFNAIFPDDCCELLKQNMTNFKILPKRIQLQHIRIQNLREQMLTHHFEGHKTYFDWNHELREQQHKTTEKESLITPYCNYVLSHCLPTIKPQYELSASILYLLLVELKIFKHYDNFIDIQILEQDLIFQQSLNNKKNFESKIEKIKSQLTLMNNINYHDWFKENYHIDKEETIDQIIKGFKEAYFIEENTMQQIQKIYKEQQYNKKNKMPDLIYMFLFLKCFDELEYYINEYKNIVSQLIQLNKQTNKLSKYFTQGNMTYENATNEDNYINDEKFKLKKEKEKYDDYIKKILLFLSSDEFQKDFYYDSEYAELNFNQTKVREIKFNVEYFSNYMQNNLTHFENEQRENDIQDTLNRYFVFKKENQQQKEFIESKRYFQPLEQGNNKKEWGKLDQDTIDERMIEIEQERKNQLIYKLSQKEEIPYIKDYGKDNIQSKWLGSLGNKQGRFVDMRPDNQKTGIYVDTVKTVEKKLDEKIDNVIKQFMQDKMNNFNKSK